jgi:Dihaem cytochrome c
MRKTSAVLLMIIGMAVAFQACATVQVKKDGPPVDPGYRLFKSKCSACHLRPEPNQYDAQSWEGILTKHNRKVPLTDEERMQLLTFLTERSRNN